MEDCGCDDAPSKKKFCVVGPRYKTRCFGTAAAAERQKQKVNRGRKTGRVRVRKGS
jgi:hypothetical protein